MHHEIVRDEAGDCQKCGMDLEPKTVEVEEENLELIEMSRRFWISAVLAIPVFISAMGSEFWPETINKIMQPQSRQWFELILATPVVLWGGWPFFVKGWASIITRHLNIFTLISLAIGVAWSYRIVATLLPGIFPATVRHEMGLGPGLF